jgi:SPX domain protein involved in polyphosphate accumulation
MKFGEHLEESKVPEWDQYYLDYKGLKDLIKQAVRDQETLGSNVRFSPRETSLTVVRAGQKSADDRFYEKLDAEVRIFLQSLRIFLNAA